MNNKGYYSPRFVYNDFDATEEEDKRIFILNLLKYHRVERKIQKTVESVNIQQKVYHVE